MTEEVETCSIDTITKPTQINYSGPPVIKVSCGKEFSMLLDVEGCVWTFGSQEFGQLGTGSDGWSSRLQTGSKGFFLTGSYNSANSKVKMRYAGLSEPFKVSRVYERDPKSKKTKLMQMMRIKSISAGKTIKNTIFCYRMEQC